MNKQANMEQKSNIIIYTTEDGLTKLETTFDEDTVWLSIDQMAELFQRDKSTISRHIKNVFSEGELVRESVVANFATTAADGKIYQVDYYNLDVIISVGYRVKSKRGTQFRIWALNILKEYMRSKSNISEHIKHIFEEEELDEESVVRKFRTTAADGKSYNTIHYNLDMIISLGYRVKSKIATNFRRWATERLKEYMIKGFTMDDERLKNLGSGNYWKELLERIRDIRTSEKVMYRQVLDLYATSVDYAPKSSESIAFFKMVQNHRQLKKQQKNIGNISRVLAVD